MDPLDILKAIKEVVRDPNALSLGSLIVVFLIFLITCFIGAYLRWKGHNLATKQDFQQLLDQNKRTIQATEEIKSQIQSRSSFQDKILLERYNLIKDMNYRLETVRIGYERMKNGRSTRIEIVNGETLLLTDLDAALQLNRAILTPQFYDLLRNRYNTVCVLWQHKDNDAEWNHQIELLRNLNDEIQNRMVKAFPFPGDDLSHNVDTGLVMDTGDQGTPVI